MMQLNSKWMSLKNRCVGVTHNVITTPMAAACGLKFDEEEEEVIGKSI